MRAQAPQLAIGIVALVGAIPLQAGANAHDTLGQGGGVVTESECALGCRGMRDGLQRQQGGQREQHERPASDHQWALGGGTR